MKRGREDTLFSIPEDSTNILLSSKFDQKYVSYHQIALIIIVTVWLYPVASHRLYTYSAGWTS